MESKQKQKNEVDPSLLLKYIKDESAEHESTEVEEWLEEDQNTQTATRMATLYYALRNYFRISSRNTDLAYERVTQKINRRKNVRKLKTFSFWTSAAASVILLFLYVQEKSDPTGGEVQEIRVEANAGIRTSVVLPDGSMAYLNSGAVISYELPFRTERKITISGEAFFEVKKDQKRAFIVTSPNEELTVKVLGTQFNVQAFEDDPVKTVTLASGEVEVGFQWNGQTLYRTLKPNEQVLLDSENGKMMIRKVHVENEIAWRDGRIIFKETPLPEVLKKLSYFYNVKFEVKDETIPQDIFTGTFDNRQLSQVLEYLKISSKIEYRIEPQTEDDSNGKKYTTVVLWK